MQLKFEFGMWQTRVQRGKIPSAHCGGIHRMYVVKTISVKNLNFVAGMTRRSVSAKRLISYVSNSSSSYKLDVSIS